MRILLVEDDQQLAASLRQGLEEAGLSVDWFASGEEGLVSASTSPYDAVILDVMLPGINGLDLVRRMRIDRLHTPVLILTAKDEVDDRVKGLEAGADDYLTKPFALKELVARIKALSRRHLPNRRSILAAGRISLDTGSHIVQVGARPVPLTTKEFAILEYFMLQQGRLLSRAEIIDHVWDYDFDAAPNLIEVYMARLRRKLTAAGTPDPFVTIRNAGYRFEPKD